VRKALVALLALAPAHAQEKKPPEAPPKDPPQDRLVRCIPCKNEGRVPCGKHDRSEAPLEDGVQYCSELADCPVCGGTGWLDCDDCENPKWPDVLARKRTGIGGALQSHAAKNDAEMKRKLHQVITDHFVLVWEVESIKVEKRELGLHEAMHLYATRLERLFTDYTTVLGASPREFRERSRVLIWWSPQDQLEASGRFAGQQGPRGIKLLGSSSVYCVCGHRSQFKDDETLHRNVIHNVAHLLLAHQEPSQWIGNIKGGWADEGLAHWFEEKYFGVCDNYCYEEQNTNVDFKGGKWKPVVRKMVAAGDLPSAADVMQKNTDGLALPMHALSFSYVDYLLALDGPKLNLVFRDLRRKVASRDAMQKHFGMNLLEFEEKWKAWVLSTYPVR
jgi:hypothetical protein